MLSVLLALILMLSLAAIVVDGVRDNIHKSDVGIIFGSKVNPNGVPSARLAARLNEGIFLYQKGIVNHLIVSGGTGKEGVDEAAAMKNYLLAHAVSADAILTDSGGYNTAATARNSAKIMHEQGFKSALIVSQYFHITRGRLAMKQCGVLPIYTAHAKYFEWRDVYASLREVLGFYDYRFIHHACNVPPQWV